MNIFDKFYMLISFGLFLWGILIALDVTKSSGKVKDH